jgi:peptidoglycan/LPS O-acetylase OafA/YrhL
LHSWSLAVEMQFYMLVPFLFWFLFKFSRSTIYFPCAVFALGSLALQLSSEEQVAFGLLFCRTWQFMAGIMAFFVVEAMESEERNGYVSLKTVIEEDAALEAAAQKGK